MTVTALVRVYLTVIRPAGRDPVTGEKLPGTTEHTIGPCDLVPRVGGPGTASRDVDGRGREGVIEGLTVYGPFDADVTHTDRVRLPGSDAEWSVDGEVGRWANNKTMKKRLCEFAIRRVAG